jgi:predicted nucleic acid-binding Zn ribbon protein
MTKKTLGYVHLEWACPNCQRKNPGPQKFCNGCGAPQPEDVEFIQAAEEKLITDEAEIARAKAGPDVHCPYCGARNPGDVEFCGGCGGNLAEAAARESGRVVGSHRDKPAPEVKCPACGTANPASAQVCSQCGASLIARPSETAGKQPAAKSASAKRGLPILGLVGGFFGCVVIAFLVYFLFIRTEELTGEVQAVSWTRTIPILALGPVEYEDWQDEIPSDAEISSCKEELRYTQDEPAPNSVEVCGTPYTVDTGTGYGEVVQDCEYEIYEDYCSYTVMDWTVFDEVTLTGSDLNPRWPDINLLSDQREGDPQEDYEVTFYADGKTYDYTAENDSEFTQFTAGSKWLLNVNALGTVTSLEKK